jgi:pimeloyl-ACP methyl ester carboxylesterase
MLHGLGASGAVWQPLVQKLDKEKWQIITIDLLGFGDSPRPSWNKYTVNEHAHAVRSALLRLRLKNKVVFVGHSMGCLVASHLVAKDTKLAQALILYQPPLFANQTEYEKHLRLRQRYFAAFDYLLAHPHLLLAPRRLVKLIHKLYGVRMSSEDWLPFERSLRNTIMEQKLYDELQMASIPTHIIHGRLDFLVPRVQMAKMFTDNKHIALHVITHTHHISARSATFIAKLLDKVYE